MTGVLGEMDGPCPACGRVTGEHTLREFNACMAAPTLSLPYEVEPRVRAITDDLRERFGIDQDVVIADHIIARALRIEGGPGRMVQAAALHLEFGMGIPGRGAAPVARVLLVSDPPMMRKIGKLVRDSANGAANAAERP